MELKFFYHIMGSSTILLKIAPHNVGKECKKRSIPRIVMALALNARPLLILGSLFLPGCGLYAGSKEKQKPAYWRSLRTGMLPQDMAPRLCSEGKAQSLGANPGTASVHSSGHVSLRSQNCWTVPVLSFPYWAPIIWIPVALSIGNDTVSHIISESILDLWSLKTGRENASGIMW